MASSLVRALAKTGARMGTGKALRWPMAEGLFREMRIQHGAVRPPCAMQTWRWMSHDHGHSHGGEHDGPTVKITFVSDKEGTKQTVDAKVGMDVMRVAHAHGIDLEGACEGSLACSTCHVILDENLYSRLQEPSDDENDMLDLAFGLTDTSRLGCQVIVTEDMEGSTFRIPSATRNMYVDGHKPKPH